MTGGTYYVRVENNLSTIKGIPPDPSALATNDTDGTLILTSTGTYRGVIRQIKAAVTIPGLPTPPGAITAFGPIAKVELESAATRVDGNNYTPPSLPCTGAGCNGTLNTSIAAIPGVTFNSLSAQLTFKSPTQVIGGNPSAVLTDTTLSPTPWRTLGNSLILLATQTVTGAGGAIAGTQTWGTPTSPQITYVTGSSKVQISGQVSGAGVMVVDTKFEVKGGGTFTFEGLIIVMDTGKVADHELETELEGTANIFGALVVIPSSSTTELEVELKGNSAAKYSQTAIGYAQNITQKSLNTTLLTWREAN